MKEPPGTDDGGEEDESDGLVAAEGEALGFALLLFGDLLEMRLNMSVDHGCFHPRKSHAVTNPKYRCLAFSETSSPIELTASAAEVTIAA